MKARSVPPFWVTAYCSGGEPGAELVVVSGMAQCAAPAASAAPQGLDERLHDRAHRR